MSKQQEIQAKGSCVSCGKTDVVELTLTRTGPSMVICCCIQTHSDLIKRESQIRSVIPPTKTKHHTGVGFHPQPHAILQQVEVHGSNLILLAELATICAGTATPPSRAQELANPRPCQPERPPPARRWPTCHSNKKSKQCDG